MSEGIRNSDRALQIEFGQFYLDTFGATAAWGELKEALQIWGTDSGANFSTQDSNDHDPKILGQITDLLKTVADKSPKAESKSEAQKS